MMRVEGAASYSIPSLSPDSHDGMDCRPVKNDHQEAEPVAKEASFSLMFPTLNKVIDKGGGPDLGSIDFSLDSDVDGNGELRDGADRLATMAFDDALASLKLYAPIFSTHANKELVREKASLEALCQHLRQLFDMFDLPAQMHRAIEDAKDFVFPDALVQRDANLLKELGSVKAVIHHHHKLSEPSRLNRESFTRCILESDEEYDIGLEIASEGFTIDVPDLFLSGEDKFSPYNELLESRDFVRNALVAQTPRPLQVAMQNNLFKHAAKNLAKGQAILLPIEVIPAEERDESVANVMSWAGKPGEVMGRFINDASYCASGDALNDGNAKELAIERYGRIHNPTTPEIITNWYSYAEENAVPISECLMYKDDIKGAFPQNIVDPPSALLLGMYLAAGLIYYCIRGCFGWTGNPMVWGVISRILLRRLLQDVKGCLNIFVDDIIGLSLPQQAMRDKLLVCQIITEFFNHDATNPEKSVDPTPVMDVLGSLVNLPHQYIRPNAKGCDKIFYIFFGIDPGVKHTLRTCQVLAGVTMRYSTYLPFMKPFVAPFYAQARKYGGNKLIKKTLSSYCKFLIEIWRFIGLMLYLDPETFRLPLYTLRTDMFTTPRLLTVVDASPWKVMVTIRLPNAPSKIQWHSEFHLPYDPLDVPNDDYRTLFPSKTDWPISRDPGYQNSREYQGQIFGFIIAIGIMNRYPEMFGPNDHSGNIPFFAFSLKGDNASALQWAEKERTSSLSAWYANVVEAWLRVHCQMRVVSIEHMPGIHMGVTDKRSRNDHSLDGELNASTEIFPQDVLGNIKDVFRLCDPSYDKRNQPRPRETFLKIHELMLPLCPIQPSCCHDHTSPSTVELRSPYDLPNVLMPDVSDK
jgi:hypothetical protein